MLPKIRFFDRLILNLYEIKEKKILFAFKWVLKNLHTIFSQSHIEIPYLEIMVTQKCNLRCKKCSNLMPLFSKPQDFSIDILLEDIEKILNNVDKIYKLKILGGEPFLYKQLPQLIGKLADNPKVKVIELVTNGTVIPNDEVIASLVHPKIKVVVSPYDAIVIKKPTGVADIFKQRNVQYFFPDLAAWKDFGDFTQRKRSHKENKQIYEKCFKCVTLIDGEIFCCPRAGNGAALGLVPKVQGECVKIRGKNDKEIKKNFKKFSKLTMISTCDYCDNPGPDIPIAEQI